MAGFFKSQPFEEREGKTYFRRGRVGPVYEVNEAEITALIFEAKLLRTKMIVLVSVFVGVFLITLLLLPQILDLNYQMALMVVLGLVFISFLPFGLLVKFNLGHQKKIRGILGNREGVIMAPMKPAENAGTAPSPIRTPKTIQRKGINTNALAFLFLLGIAITTVGVVMLFYTIDLPFRKQFIWWMNIFTGFMLTGLGLYGLVLKITKKPKKPNPPAPQRDDPGGQP